MRAIAGCLSLLFIALALAGCVAAGPSYTPQELASVKATSSQNEADARAHKITWVEASRRDTAKAREVGGARVTPTDELNFSMHAALAAEVDAGRITPEIADFKYQQALVQQRGAQQARDDEQRRRFGEAMMAAGQGMQNAAAAARPVICTSTQMGIYTNTTCN